MSLPTIVRGPGGSAGPAGAVDFDVCGPLPRGTTVLEASAGTGKTFTIAALAARYVAQGHAGLPELMLVTFGREATHELRERIRERLGSAHRGLADPAAARGGTDAVLALLATADDTEVAHRRARLATALAGFDAATIATTHGFCQEMLAGLGLAGGGTEPGARFVESVDDLVEEVVDDFYVRKYGARTAGRPEFDRRTARLLATRAVHDGQARLAPIDAEPGSVAHTRWRFATAVRHEVERRKRARRLLTYDDLLTRLDDAVGSVSGAAARLRRRYRVVLVDEFQDTDPVQWRILSRAFHGHTDLVLIGDPKQAIYAFRGADVHSYLTAREDADQHATLMRNHRSDPDLLAALHQVHGATALGDPRIVVGAVVPARTGARLAGAPVTAPLRLRYATRAGSGLPTPPRRDQLVVGPARDLVAADLATDVAALLASAATVAGAPVRPGDVAVLVRTNVQGATVAAALTAAGVPAVLSGTASVFAAPAAADWLALLEACEQPRAARVRAAALTDLIGVSVAQLCGPDADAVAELLGTTVRTWAAVLAHRGVAALLESVTTDTDLPRRLLARTDGERALTDLRHIGQALHAAAVDGHLGPSALVDWLRHRIADAAADTGTERSRRLESDAAAVQIITIHRSKGLEFPIVYLPFAWDRNVSEPQVPLLHDPDDGARVLDVGGETGQAWRRHCAAARAEDAGEDLRLLYVALTRAACQVVTWWMPATTTAASPLHRLLMGRPGGTGPTGTTETTEGRSTAAAPGTFAGASSAVFVPEQSYPVPSDDVAVRCLRALAGPLISVEELAPVPAPVPGPADDATTGVALRANVFTRELDLAWRRTSYTALTAAQHGGAHPPSGAGAGAAAGVLSEPEHIGTDDEGPDPDLEAGGTTTSGATTNGVTVHGSATNGATTNGSTTNGAGPNGTAAGPDRSAHPSTGTDLPSPMAELPLGAGFGTLVHGVLEVLDPTAPDLADALHRCCTDQLAAHPLPGLPADVLATALAPALHTPLGPVGGGLTLGGISPTDRLAELAFELPLAGGDTPTATALLLDALPPLLRDHLGPGDPLHRYPDALATLHATPLRGYLTGSIDAVVRRPDGRFVIVDYKTNWLGPIGPDGGREPLTTTHYTPDRLAQAMIDAHYPLQALLYAVALHRFLRWRLPGYTPHTHLGGALYLFVRGMCGPDTPQVDGTPCGVFGWSPPPALVAELSALLEGTP